MRRQPSLASDRGSGTLLAIALAGALAAVSATALPLYMALATRQSVEASADASALAAADAASGAVVGYPCAVADLVASSNGTTLTACDVDGLVATVSTTRWIVGVAVIATATAGPPRGEPD